jgi:hypothetical protein
MYFLSTIKKFTYFIRTKISTILQNSSTVMNFIDVMHFSSVGIVTGYELDGPGIESRWGARFFAHVQTGPGAHPASCTMGTGSFPGVKRPGRGADHPPPSSAEVKKE